MRPSGGRPGEIQTDAGRIPLTQLIHASLLNPLGEKLGRVEDIVVRMADGGAYPTVTGLKARVGGRELFVGAGRLAGLGPDGARMREETLNLARFERRPGEVLLAEDVLDRALINVAAGRLVHANDLMLAPAGEQWQLVGVDPSPRGVLRRLLPRHLRRVDEEHGPVLDWKDIQAFVGHVPTARLLIPPQRLRRLHPAQIADLVEAASHEQGEEIIGAVQGDPELSADVFEELDVHHQLEFLRSRSNEHAAALLARMAPDAAADLLGEMDQHRRLPVLTLVAGPQQQKLRALLKHHPTSAGGLMSPDFISVPRGFTIAQALEHVRSDASTPHELLGRVFVTEPDGRLLGAVDTVDLVRGVPETPIEDLEGLIDARVRADSDLQDVALLMADFNLTAVPVVESDGRVIGAISVDDILVALIPEDQRRRAEADPSA